MNKSKIINWIKNPSSIAEDETRELREIINDFPASPILHWLYLKGLQNQKSYLFNSALSRTAIASPERGQLLKWVGQADDENHKKNKFEFNIPEEKEVIPPVKTVTIPKPTPAPKAEKKPIERTLPKPKPTPKVATKKEELPDEILALLEKSKRIREGYHGAPQTEEKAKPTIEVAQPVVPKTIPEPEIIPVPKEEIVAPTPLPKVEETAIVEKEPDQVPQPEKEIEEPFDFDLNLEEKTEIKKPG